MGTLERIRKTSPFILAVIAIAFIAFMVLSDLNPDETFRQRENPNAVAIMTVNGEEYLNKAFDNEVQAKKEEQLRMNPDNPDVDDLPIRIELFNFKQKEIIYKQAADNLGIIITEKEQLDELIENPHESIKPSFTDSTGKFDKNAYMKFHSQFMMNPNGWAKQQYDLLKQRHNGQEPSREEVKALENQAYQIYTFFSELEKSIPQLKREKNMRTLIGNAEGIISPAYARQAYMNENSTANVSFIYFPIRNVNDSVTVPDKDIEAYYNKYKKFFKQKPMRKIKYLTFKVGPEANDTTNMDKIVKNISRALAEAATPEAKSEAFSKLMAQNISLTHDYIKVPDLDKKISPYIIDLNVNDVAGPVTLDSGTYFFRLDDKRQSESPMVKSSHILLKFKNKDDKKEKDSLKKEAMKIYKMATAKDADFAELARQRSQDEGSAQSGGDLPWYSKGGGFVKEFEDALFNNEPGSIVGPIETQFGYHIIKISDKKAEEIKYSEIRVTVKISETTKNRTVRNIREIYTAVSKDGKNFDSVAAKYNLTTNESQFFKKTDPIINSQFLTDKVFEAEPGSMLDWRVTNIDNNLYYLIQVTEARDAGIQPLEDVKDIIKLKLTPSKKLDIVKKQAEEMYAKISNMTNIEQVRAIDSSLVKNIPDLKNNGQVKGIGQDFVFTNAAFTTGLNKMTKLIRGENGYFILQVNSRTVPTDAAIITKGVDELSNRLQRTILQSAFFKWIQKITEDAELEDNRSKLWSKKY